ncbi:cell division control protein 45 [Paragonimus westermani]|uniref:Cell division control protein 45 n=1 Tax=Paragonimus westermani TaxID=34504 RepID=A0A5J4P0Z3_9TREM|nr:cell division control protein 45 [Paragonimus westermani]
MVLVNDARTEFYGELIGKRVLVFVLPDIDGLCAWRILKELFVCRQIMYTLLVVNNKHELQDFFAKNKDSVREVVLVNCGANFDIIGSLEPNTETIFYVCDSRRPIHINNFYNQRQIKLVCLNEDTSDVPKFEDVFQQFSSDEESAGESDDDEKRRTNANAVEKRIEKRRWLRRRQDILMDYESFSFYTVSTSVVLFDLAWRLSQENTCLLWFAIVGQTSQLLTNCINREHYVDQLDYLQSHVSRLGHMGSHLSRHSGMAEEHKAKIEIMFEEELALWLYKHWSLKETLETSMVTASKFKLFTEGGQKKMQEFLVHVGLSRRDIFLPSFTVQLGYKTPISAIDAVFLAMSALGCHGEDGPGENFQRALETLSCWSLPSLESELGLTQAHLQNLASQVRNLIDTDEVVAFGPFLYVYIRKTSLVSPSLRNPLSLSVLAKYMLMAKAALRPKLGRDRRIAQMPLILCIDSRADEENIVLMGIPPLHGDDDRNLFGQAFEAGVRRTKAKAQFCYFDNNCKFEVNRSFVTKKFSGIELRREDMLKLFEALAALLS